MMKHIYFIWISAIILLSGSCLQSPEPGFIEYPVNKLAVKSTKFSLHSGENEIFVEKYKTYYYAHFELRSSLPLTLKSAEPITEFEISPQSYGIVGTQAGNAINFTIVRPGYVLIRINKDQRIFVLVDKVQKPLDSEVVNILDYDVDVSGDKVLTSGIQKALNEISGTGKILDFPAGIYKTGVLSIKSNSRIHLSPGAIIMGSDEISDHYIEEDIQPRPLILIKDAENIEISGRGILDANGTYLRDTYGEEGRGRLILMLNSKNVTIDGIVLRDPPSWNTHILHSEDVIIRNIKMLNDIYISNTDGFDPDASKRVLIENCFAYCGDDNVAVKSTNKMGYLQDVEDITVKDCVFLTKKSALKVGTESNAGMMKNITFENNEVLESDRGMTLYCYDGATYENISFINNRFERTFPDRCQCGIHFRIRKRNKDSKAGVMSQILIKDCSFLWEFPNPALINGFDDDHSIELQIDNLTIAGIPLSTENEASILETTFTDITYE